MEWIDITTSAVRLRALTWGPSDGGPITLCLQGFPDTAHGFRMPATHLVAGRLSGGRALHVGLRAVVASLGPHLPHRRVMNDATQMRTAVSYRGTFAVLELGSDENRFSPDWTDAVNTRLDGHGDRDTEHVRQT